MLGIVTGRPRNEVLFALKKFGVEAFFDVVVAMEDYPAQRSKPDPFSLNLALEKLGKETAVYVGDSVDDMKAAKLANMRPIGCLPPGVKMNNLKTVLKKMAQKWFLKTSMILLLSYFESYTRTSQ